MTQDTAIQRYLNGDYAEKNPDWDSADSPWKASKVAAILSDNKLVPRSITEVGCGAGKVLAALQHDFPDAKYEGYDIAPQLQGHWKEHNEKNITFILGDYLDEVDQIPDVVLILDVIEHLGDPFNFLARLSEKSHDVVFHFPLDLSAASVLRERPLLHVRDKVGHLHFYTKGLVLPLIEEAGFDIVESRYTNAATTAPQRSIKTRLMGWVRQALYLFNKDLGVRLLGGETLLILARSKHHK